MQVAHPQSHDGNLGLYRQHLRSQKQWSLRFTLPTTIRTKTTSLTMAVLMTLLLCLLECISPIQSARSSADIGLCETSVDGKLTTLDCLKGKANFCCFDKLVTVGPDKLSKWTKKCCTESEYMDENWYLVVFLLVCTVAMFSMVIIIALSSFSSIILTEKASLE